jgi:hypothetical protein
MKLIKLLFLFAPGVFAQDLSGTLAPKNGGASHVGGGGDSLEYFGTGTKFLDTAERVGFSPKNLKIWGVVDQQLKAIKVNHPGIANVLRGIFEGKGPMWFFSSGQLKNIPDEEISKLNMELSLGYKLEQAAIYNNGEIIISAPIFLKLESDLDRMFLLFHEAIRANFDGLFRVDIESNNLRKLVALLTHPNIAEIDQEIVWKHLLQTLKQSLPVTTVGTCEELLPFFSNYSKMIVDSKPAKANFNKTNGGFNLYELLTIDPAYNFSSRSFEIGQQRIRTNLSAALKRFSTLEDLLSEGLARHLVSNEKFNITFSNYKNITHENKNSSPQFTDIDSVVGLVEIKSITEKNKTPSHFFQLLKIETDANQEIYRFTATPILLMNDFPILKSAVERNAKVSAEMVGPENFKIKSEWKSVWPQYILDMLKKHEEKK